MASTPADRAYFPRERRHPVTYRADMASALRFNTSPRVAGREVMDYAAPIGPVAAEGMGFDDFDAWTGAPISDRARELVAAEGTPKPRKPRLVRKEGGYFEVWERACGHQYRIDTESWSGPDLRAVLPGLRREAAARSCTQCAASWTLTDLTIGSESTIRFDSEARLLSFVSDLATVRTLLPGELSVLDPSGTTQDAAAWLTEQLSDIPPWRRP